MKFLELSNYFQRIEETPSRNEMTEILVDLYGSLNEKEVQIVSYLLVGRVAPYFVPAEFNFSEKSLVNLVGGEGRLGELGDIGLLLEEVSKEKGGEMEISEVYEVLWKLVNTTGSGSQARMANLVSDTLGRLSPLEAKFFSRIIVGKLRLGFSTKTVLDAFSFLLSGDKSMREELDRAYGVAADLGHIASVVTSGGKLGDVSVIPGIPVLSRLVERVKSFEEVFERLGDRVLVQPKFDGLRCQIHKVKGSFDDMYSGRIWAGRLENGEGPSLFGGGEGNVRLFTRNLEDVTEMFPEIVEAAKALPMDSFILDSEVIGWDGKTFLSYQETMQRKRKYDVGGAKESVPVRAFVFDILYSNGKSLLGTDTEKRIKMAEGLLDDGDIVSAETLEVTDAEGLKEVFDRYVAEGLEGAIAKTPEGGYLPGVRNYDWIKLKKSMLKDLVDTVDLIVMGYYKGAGKRSDFGVGAILGGVYNEEEDRFESCTKIGTGITDEQFVEIKGVLGKIESKGMPDRYYVDDRLKPDVWVLPEVIIEVDADELTKGKDTDDFSPSRGLSLRFPRLIEFGREKLPEEVTSVDELFSMYKG